MDNKMPGALTFDQELELLQLKVRLQTMPLQEVQALVVDMTARSMSLGNDYKSLLAQKISGEN